MTLSSFTYWAAFVLHWALWDYEKKKIENKVNKKTGCIVISKQRSTILFMLVLELLKKRWHNILHSEFLEIWLTSFCFEIQQWGSCCVRWGSRCLCLCLCLCPVHHWHRTAAVSVEAAVTGSSKAKIKGFGSKGFRNILVSLSLLLCVVSVKTQFSKWHLSLITGNWDTLTCSAFTSNPWSEKKLWNIFFSMANFLVDHYKDYTHCFLCC